MTGAAARRRSSSVRGCRPRAGALLLEEAKPLYSPASSAVDDDDPAPSAVDRRIVVYPKAKVKSKRGGAHGQMEAGDSESSWWFEERMTPHTTKNKEQACSVRLYLFLFT